MPGGRRPPVARALRDLVQLRLRTGQTGAFSLDEARDAVSRMTRRRFLWSVGAAAAGTALAGCTTGGSSAPTQPATGTGSDLPSVVVVGAGLAGLTTAYRLGQAGVPCRVFETRDRIGGRCWSARDWAAGQVGEHGGEFIDTRHVHLRGLVDELGLQLDDLWAAWDDSLVSLSWVDGGEVDREQLFEPIDRAAQQLAEQARRMGSYLAGEASARAIAFDQRTAAEWFVAATGERLDSPLGRLFGAEQAGWWGLDLADLGATNMVDFFAVEWPGGDERYTVHGGNDQVPQALADALPDGTVVLESPLEAVRATSSGGFTLRFTGMAEEVDADILVLALPFTTLRDVDLSGAGFSATKRRAIDTLGMGTNAKVLLQLDQLTAQLDRFSGYLQRGDHPRFSTWQSGETDVGSPTHTLLTVYSGGRAGASFPTEQPHAVAPTEVADQTLLALDEMVPGIAAAQVGEVWLDCWAKDPWSRGSYAAFLPGQTTSFLGTLGDAEGNAHFAGEHTSVYSQGFLNGGAESGSRVAGEILDALGIAYPEGLARAFQAAQRYQPVYPWA